MQSYLMSLEELVTEHRVEDEEVLQLRLVLK